MKLTHYLPAMPTGTRWGTNVLPSGFGNRFSRPPDPPSTGSLSPPNKCQCSQAS